jgi:hypothetical protein
MESSMATISRLTDTHLVILSQAARHCEGRVLPLPKSIGNKGGTAKRALKSLLRRRLVQEGTARPDDQEWARGAQGQRLTLTITPAGLSAIGVTEPTEHPNVGSARGRPVVNSAAPDAVSQVSEEVATSDSPSLGAAFRDGTKGAAMVKLLRHGTGAALPDLMSATGWQAHSVRGFLSGTLRKKHGLNVASERADGIRRYRITA